MHATLTLAAALSATACASTPESRLRDEVLLDVYWTAARECESRYRTLHITRLMADGALSLSADANSRIDAAGFLECYWQGVQARVERRCGAGLPVPDGLNLRPDVDID
ncbi:MAG TPA: hypothetical protein VLK28_15435 [Methylomirabilota bacterium]|nr:hypothetical protein [Methylomirabilota bacterium]